MARVTFVDCIQSVWGAIDSAKEGKEKGYRLVIRRHDYGEGKNYDSEGRKWHELYYYHLHVGEWSERVTSNREMFKVAQRMAHDIERRCKHPEEFNKEEVQQVKIWGTMYAEYLETLAKGSTHRYGFYGFVYKTIYGAMRNAKLANSIH